MEEKQDILYVKDMIQLMVNKIKTVEQDNEYLRAEMKQVYTQLNDNKRLNHMYLERLKESDETLKAEKDLEDRKMKDFSSTMRRMKAEIDDLKEEVQMQQVTHLEEKKSIKANHAQAMKAQATQHAAALQLLEANHAEFIETQAAQHAAALQAQEANHAELITTQANQHAAALQAKDADHAQGLQAQANQHAAALQAKDADHAQGLQAQAAQHELAMQRQFRRNIAGCFTGAVGLIAIGVSIASIAPIGVPAAVTLGIVGGCVAIAGPLVAWLWPK